MNPTSSQIALGEYAKACFKRQIALTLFLIETAPSFDPSNEAHKASVLEALEAIPLRVIHGPYEYEDREAMKTNAATLRENLSAFAAVFAWDLWKAGHNYAESVWKIDPINELDCASPSLTEGMFRLWNFYQKFLKS